MIYVVNFTSEWRSSLSIVFGCFSLTSMSSLLSQKLSFVVLWLFLGVTYWSHLICCLYALLSWISGMLKFCFFLWFLWVDVGVVYAIKVFSFGMSLNLCSHIWCLMISSLIIVWLLFLFFLKFFDFFLLEFFWFFRFFLNFRFLGSKKLKIFLIFGWKFERHFLLLVVLDLLCYIETKEIFDFEFWFFWVWWLIGVHVFNFRGSLWSTDY